MTDVSKVTSGEAYYPPPCSDFRCPACRQRNCKSGPRKLFNNDFTVFWFCPVKGCQNHEDYFDPNTPAVGPEAR